MPGSTPRRDLRPFSNKGQTLVVQFTVKHEQNIDCGGGYVKLFPAGLNRTDMHGDSNTTSCLVGDSTPGADFWSLRGSLKPGEFFIAHERWS